MYFIVFPIWLYVTKTQEGDSDTLSYMNFIRLNCMSVFNVDVC